jgi:hypothetical protein
LRFPGHTGFYGIRLDVNFHYGLNSCESCLRKKVLESKEYNATGEELLKVIWKIKIIP